MDKPNVKDQLKGLIKTAPPTPVQEVKPVTPKKQKSNKKRLVKDDDEFHINARIPMSYERIIKRYCLDHDINIRTFLIEAIDAKLKEK